MKYVILFALSLVGLTSQAQVLTCPAGESQWSRTAGYEFQNCTTSGYCTAYDYNPQTSRYETFYGYHSNCEGRQQRQTETLVCRREDGSFSTQTGVGYWENCQIR